MNRRSLTIAIAVTTLAVAAGVAVAMMQSTSEKAAAPNPQPTNIMSPNSPVSTPSTPVASPSVSPNSQPDVATNAKGEPSRRIESCTIKMVRVDDPNPPLNVRSSPTTAAQNIVGKVENGTFLTVAKEQDGWLQITDPVQGWVAKSRTQHGCNQKVERVSFGTGNTSAEISDRFIGTGFHKYLLNARAGQTITITRQSGPIPFVIQPDGQVLAEIPDERDRWSGTLPTSGDYVLQLDSNYKGYAYSFLVEIQ